LDASAFKQGTADTRVALKQTKDEADKTAKEMEASGKRAALYFSNIKNEALALVGVLLGGRGLAAFVSDATTSLASLGRQAHNIGLTVPALAAFRNMIERNGGSAEAAAQSFQNLQDQMEEFKLKGGQPAAVPALSLIGALGEARANDVMGVYKRFVAFADAHKNDPLLIRNIGHMLGLDEGSINEAMKGTAQVNADLAKSYELGVPTDDMIKRVTALQGAWISLQQAGENLGNSVLANLAPSLKTVLDDMTHMIEKKPDLVAAITEITGGFLALRAVGSLAKVLGLSELAATLTSLEGIVLRLSPWLATLSLSGDTPNADDQGRAAAQAAGGKAWEDWQAAHPNPASWAWDHIKSWFTGPKLAADVEKEIRAGATAAGLDADHMAALATQEAGGYDTVSPAGAIGPMQLMPGTARGEGVDPHDWHQNIKGGLSYYQKLLKQFGGNYAVADAAYNAGPMNPGVLYFARTGDPSRLPAETKKYIAAIDHIKGPVGPVAPQVNLDIGNSMVPPPIQRSPYPDTSALVPPPGLRSPYPDTPTSTDNSSSVSIQNLHVHTQATDATGISKEINRALTDEMTTQANRGLQ
jgi:hypothetical protein